MINYESIKQTAKEKGIRVADLCALAPKNDPFYTGRPSEETAARWFAGLWASFGYERGVHLRRMHYRIVSQETPITRPDGQEYQNTDRDWNYLNEAGKWARYMGLVLPESFVDRRNPEAIINAHYYEPGDLFYEDPTPDYSAYDPLDEEQMELYRLPDIPELPELPETLPDLPGFDVYGYRVDQPVHVEVWCEKTTMNDILEPLCRSHRVNLVTGAGEMSITACMDFMRRVHRADKPARILYISDFDPAGLGMPISVARKIEFFQRTDDFGHLDIRLFPVCLTAEQVDQFKLPRVPVKDSDLRKAGFEAVFGKGQVELDALESLHPGELQRLVSGEIQKYRDDTLLPRSLEVKRRLEERLDRIAAEAAEAYALDLTNLEEEYFYLSMAYDKTRQDFADLTENFQAEIDQHESRLALVTEALKDVYGKLSADLQQVELDMSEFDLPEPDLPEESEDDLYVSGRDYLTQLIAYKAHRNGAQS